MTYLPRIVDDLLSELVAEVAAVALEGARGVGRSTTARQHARTMLSLDEPAQRDLVHADIDRALRRPAPVLIDAWTRVPDVWNSVRRAVDDGARAGSFLLVGSAFPRGAGLHSGAGRIVRLRMRPMTLVERGVAAPTVSLAALLSGRRGAVEGRTDVGLDVYAEEICRSGLPGIRALPSRSRGPALDGHLEVLISQDVPALGRAVRHPAQLRRWLTAYAAAESTVTAFDRLPLPEGPVRPAKTTTTAYRDVLDRLSFLDPVHAWAPVHGRPPRLAAAPKHHLVDPAFAARLLGVNADDLLEAAPATGTGREATLLGQLFESLVTLDVRVHAQAAEARTEHLRVRGGAREIDLIVERGGRVLPIEVKLGATVSDADVKHLHWLQRELGDDVVDAVVITTGTDAYRRRDGIAVVPAALLGP